MRKGPVFITVNEEKAKQQNFRKQSQASLLTKHALVFLRREKILPASEGETLGKTVSLFCPLTMY